MKNKILNIVSLSFFSLLYATLIFLIFYLIKNSFSLSSDVMWAASFISKFLFSGVFILSVLIFIFGESKKNTRKSLLFDVFLLVLLIGLIAVLVNPKALYVMIYRHNDNFIQILIQLSRLIYKPVFIVGIILFLSKNMKAPQIRYRILYFLSFSLMLIIFLFWAFRCRGLECFFSYGFIIPISFIFMLAIRKLKYRYIYLAILFAPLLIIFLCKEYYNFRFAYRCDKYFPDVDYSDIYLPANHTLFIERKNPGAGKVVTNISENTVNNHIDNIYNYYTDRLVSVHYITDCEEMTEEQKQILLRTPYSFFCKKEYANLKEENFEVKVFSRRRLNDDKEYFFKSCYFKQEADKLDKGKQYFKQYPEREFDSVRKFEPTRFNSNIGVLNILKFILL
ncbi:MAG: hypothetical protein PHE89_03310 [Alphaproteobacteria bacterium]|nr:hypothetical protein [Alphaproteobacteria bacterium]